MQHSDLHIDLELPKGKHIYFAGDFHLGYPDVSTSALREQKLVAWLDDVKKDAAAIFLMGDQFDFWFEYPYVTPKGHVRFLGKLAELNDSGIKLFMFRGNHDMWTRTYWEQELGATVIGDGCRLNCSGKLFYLHHGDGLGPGEHMYKLLRKIFRAPWSSWLFARLHPNLGFYIATLWSSKSRKAQGTKYHQFLGEENEHLLKFARSQSSTQPYDFYVFGHRHLTLDILLTGGKRYINTGTWLNGQPYAVFDGLNVSLQQFTG